MPGNEKEHSRPNEQAAGQEQQEQPALLATRLFVQASTEYSTSVVFQGGRIAALCRELHMEPSLLGQALVADDTRMQQLIRTATTVHKKQGIDLDISLEHAKNIIESDFEWAERLTVLRPETLTGFLQLFPHFEQGRADLGINLTEQLFQAKAELLLAQKE